MNLLGDTIDIHGGGNDLIFPHHENEILQSWSVTQKPLANYWLHNGMLQTQEEKMSKSLKNFFTVRQILNGFSREDIRFFILNTHYRGPLNFSEIGMEEAAASLNRLHNTYSAMKKAVGTSTGRNDAVELVEKARQVFVESMDDDFNTRAAISGIFDLAREANRMLAEGSLGKKGATDILGFFEEVDQVLGILPGEQDRADVSSEIIQILIEVRQELRKRKLFDLADGVRDKLLEKGIEIEDTAEGVKWKRK
jgi:cysteinyl-tRNA synthetase